MIKHFLAAIFASAVLISTVSPVFAADQHESTKKRMPPEIQAGFDRLVIPSGNGPTENESLTAIQEARLRDFVQAVNTGEANRIAGLFVPEYGGFYVVQQPARFDGLVSPVDGVLTQYLKPSTGGVTGLLAHNYGAGKWFDNFGIGVQLFVIFGDGLIKEYRIRDKLEYQALEGWNMLTDLVELETGVRRTANQVYEKVYTGNPHLTLQTCIQSGSDLTWGRLFLLADPV